MSEFSHDTVLLKEAIDSLDIKESGTYVDATFGRGGHSRLLLSRLGRNGRLIGLDKDPVAIKTAKELACKDSRFQAVHCAFSEIAEALSQLGFQGVDGVLADLGVSSPQLDDALRGFSFTKDGPLDMRMDVSRGQTAAEWLAKSPEKEIARVLKEYGEERFSRRIAGAIVRERLERPILTTLHLANIVAEANPAWEKHKHPATRAFQAIRIEINQELAQLEKFLSQTADSLKPGGRLAVISFHSLEDRIVKRFMRDKVKGPQLPRGVPVSAAETETDFSLPMKPVKPEAAEVETNIRSRSAILRVMERKSNV